MPDIKKLVDKNAWWNVWIESWRKTLLKEVFLLRQRPLSISVGVQVLSSRQDQEGICPKYNCRECSDIGNEVLATEEIGGNQ